MKRKDVFVEKFLFAEFFAQPLVELAQNLWTIGWYLRIYEDEGKELVSGLFFGDRLVELSKHVEYYAKPSSIREAKQFLNDFMLGKFKKDKIRSKRVDVIREINRYLKEIS